MYMYIEAETMVLLYKLARLWKLAGNQCACAVVAGNAE